tara:strand:- start:231 stop:338 length:108 start_codon:yes stop_codon:yes gene_type:complete
MFEIGMAVTGNVPEDMGVGSIFEIPKLLMSRKISE